MKFLKFIWTLLTSKPCPLCEANGLAATERELFGGAPDAGEFLGYAAGGRVVVALSDLSRPAERVKA